MTAAGQVGGGLQQVATEAGGSLRVVQYYFTDEQALLDSGLAELSLSFKF